jgi:hypothetical protein
MNINTFLTEGDVNFSEERRKWDNQIVDPETREILNDDSRYFLHQSADIYLISMETMFIRQVMEMIM